MAVCEELRHGILLSHNVCFKHNNESKNRIHVYAAARVKAKEWEFESGHLILRLCDSVIDMKKYILGLCPLFWNRAPETLGYLFHPRRASLDISLSCGRNGSKPPAGKPNTLPRLWVRPEGRLTWPTS